MLSVTKFPANFSGSGKYGLLLPKLQGKVGLQIISITNIQINKVCSNYLLLPFPIQPYLFVEAFQHLTLFFESYDLFWGQIRSVGNNQKPVLPEKLAVVCNDMKGIYFSTLIL
jgi:hypothetical protein